MSPIQEETIIRFSNQKRFWKEATSTTPSSLEFALNFERVFFRIETSYQSNPSRMWMTVLGITRYVIVLLLQQ